MYKLIIAIFFIFTTNIIYSQNKAEQKNPALNNVLQLNITGNGYQDNIFIAYMNGATFGYDGQFDVIKLFGIYQAPQLFSIIPGNINLSINVLPDITYYNTVQLGLNVGADTTYTITATGTSSFTNYISIVLEDTKTNSFTELMQQPVYNFNASPSDSVTRFKVHFSNPTNTDGFSNDDIIIYSYKKNITIKSLKNDVINTVEIFDTNAKKIFSNSYNSKMIEIETTFPSGIYFIRTTTSKKTFTKKIHIL